MFNFNKNNNWQCFKSQIWGMYSSNANKGICSRRKCSTSTKTQFAISMSNLEVYSKNANKRLCSYRKCSTSKKHNLAISMSNLEVYSKNANKHQCSYRKCSTSKKHFLAVFTIPTFKIFSRKAN